MAQKKTAKTAKAVQPVVEELPADLVDVDDEEVEVDEAELEEGELVEVEIEAEVGVFVDEEFEDEEADEEAEGDEALDELEAEELELLEDEVSESLLVDEVAELRAIRREELTMDLDAHAVRDGEFVCQSCFLVRRTSQIANRRRMICRDCAS